jgi:DNA-binding MarR family transcriptional regulator
MHDDDLTASHFREACICLGLNRAARVISRRYDAAFKPLGITSGQFSILSALRQEHPVPISVLADVLGMDRTTLTRNLKPLEALGLVLGRTGERDRRVRRVTLTDAGRARLSEALSLWRGAQSDSDKRIGSGRWAELRHSLDALAGK